jgi:drug/metabolite transporter (DMT)-like permease
MWLFLSLGAAVLWGLNYLSAEKVMARLSPFTLMAVELAVACLFMLGLAVASGRITSDIAAIRSEPRVMGFLALSVVSYAVASLCIVLSVVMKNATLAGLIEVSYPLFIALFAWLLFREHHITPSVVVGAILIFSGVGVIAWFDH